jgi:hypothetical protein
MARTKYKGIDLPDGAEIPDVPGDFRRIVDSGPIPRFANAAERDSQLGSTPPNGTVIWRDDLSGYQIRQSSNWRGQPQVVLGYAPAVGGFPPTDAIPVITAGTAVITTNPVGAFNLPFGFTYRHAVMSFTLTPGDSASNVGFFVPVLGNCTLSVLHAQAYNLNGAGFVGNVIMRVNFAAWGY